MDFPSLVLGFGLSLAPMPRPERTDIPAEDLAVDAAGRPRLHAPDLSFLRPTTLRILGEGRFGTWSLFGSSLGSTPGSLGCGDTLGLACAPLALAELGIAWRPFGSRLSLFASVAMVSLASLRQSLGVQLVGGLRIDLPRWLGGGTLPRAER